MAVLKVFSALDTNFDARFHGLVVPDGCINVLWTKAGQSESLVDASCRRHRPRRLATPLRSVASPTSIHGYSTASTLATRLLTSSRVSPSLPTREAPTCSKSNVR